jgi:hypothetical protein
MTTPPLQESNSATMTRFVAVVLLTICVAVAVFVLAAYSTYVFALPVSVTNLALSIALCLAGILLSVMTLHGRGTWKEIAGFAVPAAVAVTVSLAFGMPGVYLAFFLAYAAHLLYKWWQRRLPTLTDET